MSDNAPILERLMAVIEDRKANPTDSSYTCSLLRGGQKEIERKILEEAKELCEAARSTGQGQRHALIREAADLTYHLLVMFAFHDVSFGELEAELARRFGVSGLAEKASRRRPGYEDEKQPAWKPPPAASDP